MRNAPMITIKRFFQEEGKPSIGNITKNIPRRKNNLGFFIGLL